MKTKLLLILSLAFTIHAYGGSATWLATPSSGEWNRARDWNPMTIPNGPSDAATFATSSQTAITITGDTEVSDIVFDAGASPYAITAQSPKNGLITLTISGAGVTNNSGVLQNFVASANGFQFGEINFKGVASAGSKNIYTIPTNPTSGASNTFFIFDDDSTAADSTFVLGSFNSGGTGAGYIAFQGNSTAANALFINQGSLNFGFDSSAANATVIGGPGGSTNISSSFGAANATFDLTTHSVNIYSTADHASFEVRAGSSVACFEDGSAASAVFTIEGGAASGAFGGSMVVEDSGTAADSILTTKGGEVSGALGGRFTIGGPVTFQSPGGATGGNAIVTLNPGQVSGALGATATFASNEPGNSNCTAGNATIIAQGGLNGAGGGAISIAANAAGGTSRMEVFGNGSLDVSDRLTVKGVTVGSLEGDGMVYLGSTVLNVGANNLDTTFPGIIQESGGAGMGHGGSLVKVGTGTLTLSGTNSYTGSTTVSSGALIVANPAGSATGTGQVAVNAGTLGGSGIISGAVTVGTGGGTGAFLAPASGSNKQLTLTLQSSLTLEADATYTYTFKAKKNLARTDLVTANGITINGATIALQGTTQGRLKRGLVLTVLSNTSANPISGTFSNLANAAIVNVNGNNLQASYSGGDGNDLTLTVVP
ncbi:MAG TPA: autotransporter-associated beta strand repeat-containing protein [Chthoniobacterales bacterium]|nr:autotransporter-associated beta strand repeat-containing protein [Chthoniobacterales bacterium]